MDFGFKLDPEKEVKNAQSTWDAIGRLLWKFAPAVVLIYLVPWVAGFFAWLLFDPHGDSSGVAKVASVGVLLIALAAIIVGMQLINWIGKIASAYYIGLLLAYGYSFLKGTKFELEAEILKIGLICFVISTVSEVLRTFFFIAFPERGSRE
jgi:predicted RND superfamily exporter protein